MTLCLLTHDDGQGTLRSLINCELLCIIVKFRWILSNRKNYKHNKFWYNNSFRIYVWFSKYVDFHTCGNSYFIDHPRSDHWFLFLSFPWLLELIIMYILWKLKIKLTSIDWFATRTHSSFLNSLAKTYDFLRSKNFKKEFKIHTLPLVEIFVLNLVNIWSYHNWIVLHD